MVAMGFMFVGFDEYLAYLLFGVLHRDVHVMAYSVFAIVDNIPFDAVQHAVVEMKAFFGQRVFQPLKSVEFQVVGNTQ